MLVYSSKRKYELNSYIPTCSSTNLVNKTQHAVYNEVNYPWRNIKRINALHALPIQKFGTISTTNTYLQRGSTVQDDNHLTED